MPELKLGEYDLYPILWNDESDENWNHQAWLYVDGHFNAMRLEAWTLWHAVHPLTDKEWLSLVEGQGPRVLH
jgi:hypothetical protein